MSKKDRGEISCEKKTEQTCKFLHDSRKRSFRDFFFLIRSRFDFVLNEYLNIVFISTRQFNVCALFFTKVVFFCFFIRSSSTFISKFQKKFATQFFVFNRDFSFLMREIVASASAMFEVKKKIVIYSKNIKKKQKNQMKFFFAIKTKIFIFLFIVSFSIFSISQSLMIA